MCAVVQGLEDDTTTLHYFWKIGVDPDGKVTVASTGESAAFPTLNGRVEGGVVRLAGTSGENQSAFILHWDGTTLAGVRILSISKTMGLVDGIDQLGMRRKYEEQVASACTREYAVGATRQ